MRFEDAAGDGRNGQTTTLDVIVSAEDDAEVRRVSITNSESRPRDIELTSYAELVLAPQSADVAHPASELGLVLFHVLLADRGFGDTKLFAYLETLGFAYVIRFRGNIPSSPRGRTGY